MKLENVKTYLKNNIVKFVPLLGMVFVIIFFAITTGGQTLSRYNLEILLNQSVMIAILATGAIFVFSMGMIDISLGASVCLTCIIAAKIGKASGSILLIILTCLVVAMVISIINGFFIAKLKLPSFIVTLAMMNILTALASMIIGTGNTSVSVGSTFLKFDNVIVKLICLIFMMGLSYYFFNIRDNGRKNKFIGGSNRVAILSGINIKKYVLETFLLCGIGIGLTAFILLMRTVTVSASTGSSLGFDVIITIVLGGMPISGGAKSKITSGLIGAVTITALNNGLVILGVSNGWIQVVRGVLFLTTLIFLNFQNRNKYLQL